MIDKLSFVLGVLFAVFLTWRIILFEIRKNAEHRRVIAYWEKPGNSENVHIVRDVMNS